ncbi:plasmid stabilization protein [Metabacillus herbersteinensis]|uniref:Plasmid stabilization protein n=1 Tax=Metabacillus herbersteinensis TaxID=283816 RepID=A0ABV6GM21_9BACI
MPHKVTLTGKSVSSLRQKGAYYTFDMEEKGSDGSPKGLPNGSTITYTVFINGKQLKKAGITEETIKEQKLMIQGEPTLDIPVDECPGEIGIICFQASILPEKEKKTPVEPVKKEEKPKGPEGTEDFVSLENIIVPEAFLNSTPNPEKTQQVIDYVKRTGYLDEPIMINRETKILTDGYRRYIVAKKVGIDLVPVAYEK